MIGSCRQFLRRLRSESGGNVTILLALGLPVLIGGAGLAVDISQWFVWKRELQYAVDQAALAGAWAQMEPATQAVYRQRARQEFDANLQLITGFRSDPSIELGNYNGQSGNSVVVRASAGRRLPFSSLFMTRAVSINAYAQASFEEGGNWTSCLIAVDPDDDGAITIGGNAAVTASCGIAALSTSDESIIVNGNPNVDVGWILSKGGVDEWLATNTDDDIHEYMDGLLDPFKELTPPQNTTPRKYACAAASVSTTADVTITIAVSYGYYIGSGKNNASAFGYPSPRPGSVQGPVTQVQQPVPNGTAAGAATASTVTWTAISGKGQNTVWEVKTVTTTTAYSAVNVASVPAQASLLPGTYDSINISCSTVFAPGIYVIDGGRLKITGQYQVTGAGVMLVLRNNAYIDITGGANVNLTAMSSSDLETAGVAADGASSLAGMLVFEDPRSTGTKNRNRLNGNASTILNGKIYLPNSSITMDGTFGVTSQCLMIAAATITIQGTADFSTFCPPGMEEATEVARSSGSVRLVS
ncbi:Tad domain-containing protein [Croceicoccus mobilis]|uniref:Putative Flp pilus-assembly TadG-like N-terminal domain-containing protein n=1 Tax=Croceicoccus mobilis TaxID=1703339 RepID=A0A916ZAV2_9SPHN|nr:Tad domain-containing protein [Croceicoccus mobilis]GGD85071.1 hypothetical protein GCM10010990_38850 [Croceicoccus mobilis]